MEESQTFRSLIDAIAFRYEQNPRARAFVFLDEDEQAQEISNEQFYDDIQRYASGFIAKQIKSGEIVLLALDHGYELLCCFWGAVYCGAIPSVLTYWRFGSDVDAYARKVKKLAAVVRARAVITLPDLYSAASTALEPIKCPVYKTEEIAAGSSDKSLVLPELKAEQIALLQFTSGTTSEPKAIQFSHRAILDHVKANAEHNQITKDSVYVSWLPFYHDMGLINHVRHLAHGGPLVLMSPKTWLEQPVMLLRAIHRYKGTAASMPNFGFDYCVRRIRGEDLAGIDLSSWRFLSDGSEPVEVSGMQRFCERFGRYGFHPEALKVSYGMAENVAGVSTTPANESFRVDWVSGNGLQMKNRAISVEQNSAGAKAVVSCGCPYPGIDLAMVDENWSILAEREVGEIVIRSNTLFTGYYLAPEATKDLFREGWFRTGDLGYIADGQLYVCGRKKDLIIVGGKNIHPETIENIASRVFGSFAGRCVAFGVSASNLGTEMPVLVIEQKKQLDNDEKHNLIREVRKQVLDEMDVALSAVRVVPKGWVIKTTSGKIARAANREKYLDEGNNQTNEEPNISPYELTPEQVEQILTGMFEKVLGVNGVGTNDDFLEMGGDSLSALRLMLEIEQRFDREISAADFFQQPTVENLVLVLQRKISEDAVVASQAPAGFGVQQQLLSETKLQPDYLPDNRLNRIDWIKQKALAILHKAKIALLIWIYGQKWTQQIFSPEHTHIIRQFYTLIEKPLQSENEVIQCALVCNHSKEVKRQLSKQIFSHNPELWSLQVDMSKLERAYQTGKGVIVVCRHFSPLPGLVRKLILKRLNPDSYSFIGGVKKFIPKGVKHFSKEEEQRARLSIFLDQLLKCKRVLMQGGIVLILPDGNGGVSRSISFSFHGRMRGFRAGFAELALETGAAVIPVSQSIDISKRKVTILFLEHLNSYPAGMSNSKRVKFLVQKYAAFLREEWRYCPGSVPIGKMREHLRISL